MEGDPGPTQSDKSDCSPTSGARHAALSALITLLLLAACATRPPSVAPVPTPALTASAFDLATRFAPVIHQGAASDQDYLVRVDFDGDWIGNDNWEHQPTGDLRGAVYYSVVESETHWFLFYALYHPRDYSEAPCPKSNDCHENDMEAVQLAVRKDGTAHGRPEALETLAHSSIYLYPLVPGVQAGFLGAYFPAPFEDGHPVIYSETYGHGLHATPQGMIGGTVVYRVAPEGRVPAGIDDQHAVYQLVPIHDTLWAHRAEIGAGRLYDGPFDYHGAVLAISFDGEDYGTDRANPPWGYNQAIGKELRRGDWFLDPARAFAYHAAFAEPVSLRYVSNPFLRDLGLLEGAP